MIPFEEMQTTAGAVLLLCAACVEDTPAPDRELQAVTIVGGDALCRGHFIAGWRS